MYLQIWGKTNHSLIDVLYLIQQAVKAGLHSGIVAVLPRQVCNQLWQVVKVQLNPRISQPVMHSNKGEHEQKFLCILMFVCKQCLPATLHAQCEPLFSRDSLDWIYPLDKQIISA